MNIEQIMQQRVTLEESDSEHRLSSKDKTPIGADIQKVKRRPKRSSTLGNMGKLKISNINEQAVIPDEVNSVMNVSVGFESKEIN